MQNDCLEFGMAFAVYGQCQFFGLSRWNFIFAYAGY